MSMVINSRALKQQKELARRMKREAKRLKVQARREASREKAAPVRSQ